MQEVLKPTVSNGVFGERSERRRWRIQRGERVAAVKISSARRKSAQKFWAPQQDTFAAMGKSTSWPKPRKAFRAGARNSLYRHP